MTLDVLQMVIFILLGTKIAGHLCNKFHVPIVFGELMIGIILGPAVFNLVRETEGIHLLSEIGIIILMFLVGLESDLELLRKYLRPAIIVATLGVFVPFGVISLIAFILGMGLAEAVFLGIIFSATSLSITVQVLKEYNYLDNEAGAITLGAAVLDDTLVVILVSAFTAVVNLNPDEGFTLHMAWDLIGKKVLFFAICYFFAKYLMRPILDRITNLNAIKAKTSMALVLCFIFTIFAEEMGLSDIIGAFFFGMMLSTHESAHEIETDVDTIGNSFFIPIFFASIGLGVQLDALVTQFWLIFVLSFVAILTKLVGGFLGARIKQVGRKSALVVGFGMVSRGEMALIVASIGLEFGYLSEDLFTVVIASIIITTLLSPILLKLSIKRESAEV